MRLFTKPLRRGRAKLLLAIVAALVVAGGAAAYLLVGGSGSGSANAGTAQQVTITAGTPSTPLYPGDSGDVAAVISNPNSASVKINSLVLDTSQGTSGYSVDGGHSGCTNLSTILTYTSQNNSGSGWLVPANPSNFTIDLSEAISMSTSAVSACQGATFTVYLKAGP
jgi:hypothetical protein